MEAMNIVGLGAKVVDVLTRYVKKGGGEFAKEVGVVACEKVESLLIALKMRLRGDQTAIDVLSEFEKNPDRYKPVLEKIVQKKVERDKDLATELTKHIRDIGSTFDVIQEMKGVGEIIGFEAKAMKGGTTKVVKDIDKVGMILIPVPEGNIDGLSDQIASGSILIKEPVPVLLGISAPKAVKPGDIFTARFVAYIKSLEEKVKQELSGLSRGRSESYIGIESCCWKLDTHVTVKLSGKNLKVNPSESEFVWKGERNLVNFMVEVLADAPKEWIVLCYEVFIGGIRVAFIPLDLEITSSIKFDQRNIATIEPAHTAFASYASQDRARVLDRVAAVRISAGLDIFMDCLSIHPGEEWKKRLESEIENRDLFLLFWSANAKNSEWVTWEWKTALVKKGESALQLQPLQTATEAPPPEELKKFHFGDVYMMVRNAQEKKG